MSTSRLVLIAFATLALVGTSTLARADALPNCPPGTRMVMNPTPPGAMHHGGGSCVAEEPPVNPPPVNPPPPVTTTEPSTESPTESPAAPAAAPSSSMCSVTAAGAPGLALRGRAALWLLVGLGLAALRRRS